MRLSSSRKQALLRLKRYEGNSNGRACEIRPSSLPKAFRLFRFSLFQWIYCWPNIHTLPYPLTYGDSCCLLVNLFWKTRNFATSSSSSEEQKVKVPLKLYGGSGNYASALYIAATKANVLDKVESELLDLVESSKKSPKFYQFLKD